MRTARRRVLLAAAIAGLAGLALYAGTIRNDFVFDDQDAVARNPLASDPSAIGSILTTHYWAGIDSAGDLWRPLTVWSFAINHAVTGEGPAGYHATNAALHGAVSALVVALASGLGLGAGAALAAGLLFAAHPVHVEAVAPVVGRSEILAALFAIAAWITLLRATGSSSRATVGTALPRPLPLAAAAILFALALLSKENAAVLPALILAGEWVRRRGGGSWRAALISVGVLAAVLAAWLVTRSAIVPGLPVEDPRGSVFGGVDPLARILTAVGVLGRYLWLMIVPLRLSADYSFHQIPLITSALDPMFLVSAILHIALTVFGFLLAARGRLSAVGILVYLGALFPVSNIPLSIGTVMAERLLYLPSVGFCLFFPAAYERMAVRPRQKIRRAAAAALCVVCLLYGSRVLARNADWKDQYTLFSVTVKSSPYSAKARYNLGVALDDRGDRRAAIEAYGRAIEIKPDMAQARRNLGLDLLQEGRAPEAAQQLDPASRLDPNIPDVFSDLGIALHQMRRFREAEEAFRTEIRLRPGGERAHYNLGSLLLEGGRPAEALDALDRALLLAPTDVDARASRGFALAALARHAEALAAFEEALRLDPSASDLLIPLARSAIAAGSHEVAVRALNRARASGAALPEDLRALLP